MDRFVITKHETVEPCTHCGRPQGWVIVQPPYGTLADSTIVYSCEHFAIESKAKQSKCRYCGAPNSPCRQVPAPIPVSEVYCDDCAGACAKEYEAVRP